MVQQGSNDLPSPILITGAGGFIGSHLAELCVERGYRVKAFVHYRGDGSWGWLDHSPHREAMEVVAGDVRDFESMTRAMEGCRSVLHLAALVGIPYSCVSPLAYVRTNVEGTYNVLEAARRLGLERVVVTSTSETYGTAQYVPIDENHPASSQSPYAAAKVGADQLALSYFRSFDLPVAIARPFNAYGPRQSARAFVPTVITQILSGRRRLKLGNLRPTRDLTFVTDTAAAFLAVASREKLLGEAVNIGTGMEISMGDLASRIAQCIGVEIDFEVDAERVRPRGGEVERLFCDNSKLRGAAQCTPAHDLDAGLEETIAWFKENLERYKAKIYQR